MKRVIHMEKLERKHYLKHYLGGFAMVLSEGQSATGEMEDVDMEDGSVLLKANERSQWVDGANVTPSLKKFKDMNDDDIRIIVDHLIFRGEKLSYRDLITWKFDAGQIFIMLDRDRTIWITPSWSIVGMENIGRTPDNIGTIIFLLCELGYEVVPGIFN